MVRRHWGGRRTTGLVAALCLTAGCGAVAQSPPAPAGRWVAGCADGCRAEADPTVRRPQGQPTRVRVARIGLDSRLAVLGLDRSGALVPPADFAEAGWYGGGPAPATPARR
ncbi:hypothetical protein [Micromonospora sp. PLK6-60]|uniref:hypothetical protein n=1 Tax=Micromonospora sp. PLK6-60 TaxID=2873383 RepID=UPI002104293D|nr:hypothetical protein [Micromonospora sp. PLK6-60]